MINGLTFLLSAIAVLAASMDARPVVIALAVAILFCEAGYRSIPPKDWIRTDTGELQPSLQSPNRGADLSTPSLPTIRGRSPFNRK